MKALEKSMTIEEAGKVVANHGNATADLVSLIQQVSRPGQHKRNHNQQFLGLVNRDKANPNGAKGMLNEMLLEVFIKLDEEMLTCEKAFEEHCTLMEANRQDISASNAQAAGARTLVLAAEGMIEELQEKTQKKKEEIDKLDELCRENLASIDQKLEVVTNDIEVLTNILKMTECQGTKFIQQSTSLIKCNCPGQSTKVSFKHSSLRKQLSLLKSDSLKKQVLENIELLIESNEKKQPEANRTNAEVPDIEVPPDVCDGISYDDAATRKGGVRSLLALNVRIFKKSSWTCRWIRKTNKLLSRRSGRRKARIVKTP